MIGSEFLELICSPDIKSRANTTEPLVLESNALKSADGMSYPIVAGVPDLRLRQTHDDYGASSYGDIHGEFAPQSESDVKTDFWVPQLALTQELVHGKVVLLAGAGTGTELACLRQFSPARLVIMDYSDHIRRLFESFGTGATNEFFVKADLMNLPFRENSFDLVFNSGVLQQVRSPELAFRQMHGVTKVGGTISVGSIYNTSEKNRLVNLTRMRRQFHKMDYESAARKLRRIVKIRAFFERWKLARVHFLLSGRMVVPFHGNPDTQYRLNQAIDWYFPEYRHIIDEEEIRAWFADVGTTGYEKRARQHMAIKA